MSDKNLKLVHDAAARNLSAILSLPSTGMLRNHKSRFLSESDGGILLQAPDGDSALIAELIRTHIPCAVTFQSGINKVIFATRIRRTINRWRINEETVVDALLFDFPAEIKTSQKRSNYRVEIPPDTNISVRVWKISPLGDLMAPPPATREIKAEIRDLSNGGVGVRLVGKDGKPPLVCPEDRLRVALKYEEHEFVVEGRMRAPTKPHGDSIVTGIQFNNLEETLDGRKCMARLVRIIGELQRTELRMVRLGLMKTA